MGNEKEFGVTITDDEIILTRAEIAEQLQEGAAELFGSTAEDMMATYRAGGLDPNVDMVDLLMLAALLAKDDDLSSSYNR